MSASQHTAPPAEAFLASLRRDPVRLVAASAVVGVSAAAWAATYVIQGASGMGPAGGMAGPMGLDAAVAFLALWVLGMVAMMFPVTLPAAFLYDHLARTPAPGQALPATGAWRRKLAAPTFLSAYLAMYSLLGVAAWLVLLLVAQISMDRPDFMVWGVWIAPAVLIAAGLYQISPLKQRCLSVTHSPFGLFSKGWRPGLLGAGLSGARHGAYCVGCCWMLMAVMLLVGAMGLFWMAGLALVIAVERASGDRGPIVSKLVASGFVAAGVVLAASAA
jgi:predicted metal-binding membrane protein